MSVIAQTVNRYLKSHKRLVIPQLGALIVKEPDRTVVLSEMLKRDDGILRGLLAQEGLAPIEAAGAIDRFVFEVRHAAEHGESYTAEGLGIFTAGPNGTIRFRHASAPATGQSVSGAEVRTETDIPKESVAIPQPSEHIRGEKGKETPAPRLASDPSVKGLRYGKPIHTTNAYTYVRAVKRRRPDKFLLLALIAVLIAAGAIAYGYLRERRVAEEERQYLERTSPAPAGNPGASQTTAAAPSDNAESAAPQSKQPE